MNTAINLIKREFIGFVPGELRYAALKGGKAAGYPDRLVRASRGTGDRSMCQFLGTEWDTARFMTRLGNHHTDEHAKTAQAQFAKFATGMLDKYATAIWLGSTMDASTQSHATVARIAALKILTLQPWETNYERNPREEIELPFEETVFAEKIIRFQDLFVEAAALPRSSDEQREVVERIMNNTLAVGGYAAQCYFAYAQEYLSPDQYHLAASELAASDQHHTIAKT